MKSPYNKYNAETDPHMRRVLETIKEHAAANRQADDGVGRSAHQVHSTLRRLPDSSEGILTGKRVVAGIVAVALLAGTAEGHSIYEKTKKSASNTVNALGALSDTANHLPGYVTTSAVFEDKQHKLIEDVAAFEILPKQIVYAGNGRDIGVGVRLRLHPADYKRIAIKTNNPNTTTYGQYMTILASSSSPALREACHTDQADIVEAVQAHAPALVAAGAQVTVADIDHAADPYISTPDSAGKPRIFVYYDDPVLHHPTISCSPLKK